MTAAVCDPTIRQQGFNLPRQQWSLLNRFRTEQGRCGVCRRKRRLTDWSVSLWRDPDDVPHCRILSPDKTEWRLISATLCGWRRRFVADQLIMHTRSSHIQWLQQCSLKCRNISIIVVQGPESSSTLTSESPRQPGGDLQNFRADDVDRDVDYRGAALLTTQSSSQFTFALLSRLRHFAFCLKFFVLAYLKCSENIYLYWLGKLKGKVYIYIYIYTGWHIKSGPFHFIACSMYKQTHTGNFCNITTVPKTLINNWSQSYLKLSDCLLNQIYEIMNDITKNI